MLTRSKLRSIVFDRTNKEKNIQIVEWHSGEGISIIDSDENRIDLDYSELNLLYAALESYENEQDFEETE